MRPRILVALLISSSLSGAACGLARPGEGGAAALERAAALKPNSAVIHGNLGSALAGSGRCAEALREFQRALALNPVYGPALENVQSIAALL